MAGSYTGGPTVLQGTTDLVQNAYDRVAYYSLRPELYFDQVADVRATNQAMPGKTVIFTIMNELQVAATPLTEGNDVTPTTLSDSQVSVTLTEYGNAIVTSAKLRGTAFVDVDPIVANTLGYNAGASMDTIARGVLSAGTQVYYASTATSRATVTGAMVLTSTDIRKARARLRTQNVPTFGGMYLGFIHPDTAVDIQTDTTLSGWRQPHVYSAPTEIWTGDMGAYEGIRWIETPRAPTFQASGVGTSSSFGTGLVVTTGIVASSGTTGVGTFANAAGTVPEVGATLTTLLSNCTVSGTVTVTSVNFDLLQFTFAATGAGSVTISGSAGITCSAYATAGNDVYATLIVGRQALAKAHAVADGNGPMPSIIPGPVTDLLRRNVPLGWYWLGGYQVFRQAALYRIEHGSSMASDLDLGSAGPIPNIDN